MRPSSHHPRGRCSCLPKMYSFFTWRSNNANDGARRRNYGPSVSMMAPKPILGAAPSRIVDETSTSTTSSVLAAAEAAALTTNSPSEYVNTGYQRWVSQRNEWTSEPIPPRRPYLSDTQEDEIYDDLASGEHRPLPERTSLSVIVRILPEIWERESRALVISSPRR